MQPAVAHYYIKTLLLRWPEQPWQSAVWACQGLLRINKKRLKWVMLLKTFTWYRKKLSLFLK